MKNKYTKEVHNKIMKNIFLNNYYYAIEGYSFFFGLCFIFIGMVIDKVNVFTLIAFGIIILSFFILARSKSNIRKLLKTVFEDEFADYIIENRDKIFFEDFSKLKKMTKKIEYGNPEENFYLRFKYYLTVELQDEMKGKNNEKEERYKEFLEKYGEDNEK